MAVTDLDLSKYKLGWSDAEDYVFKPKKGLNEDIIREMSWMKGEPDWMLDFRLKSYRAFQKRPMPNWGGDMSEIYLDDIYYYIKPTSGGVVDQWDELPDAIKNTYEKLGIPEAERKYLAGVTAQYESEVVFHRNREDLERQGVIFCDMDTALKEYPELVKQYWAKIIPANDNKFSALNSSVWSGGSFIYVPPGVEVEMPLQAYFRINAENMGQFERTLIIADEGSQGALHRGLLGPRVHHRLAALRRGRDRREAVGPGHLHDHPELVEQRLQPRHQAGPGRGRGPHGVDRRQHRQPPHHEVPGRLHGRPEGLRARCSRSPTPAPASTRTPGPRWSTPRRRPPPRSSRSRSPRTAAAPATAASCASRTTPTAARATCSATRSSSTRTPSATPTPTWRSGARDAVIGHEATVSKVADEQLFYLMSRGLSHEQAMGMIVNGFIEPVTRTLPMEYAVEWSRLIELQMEGSVG